MTAESDPSGVVSKNAPVLFKTVQNTLNSGSRIAKLLFRLFFLLQKVNMRNSFVFLNTFIKVIYHYTRFI